MPHPSRARSAAHPVRTFLVAAFALGKLSGGTRPRRVLVVFTDSGSYHSSRGVRLKDLRRLIRGSETLAYGVVVYGERYPWAVDPFGAQTLGELAAASGGKVYYADRAKRLNEIADGLALRLRHQYAVGFAPADAAKKGELNKVRVRIKRPPDYKGDIYVRSREGYLTPE